MHQSRMTPSRLSADLCNSLKHLANRNRSGEDPSFGRKLRTGKRYAYRIYYKATKAVTRGRGTDNIDLATGTVDRKTHWRFFRLFGHGARPFNGMSFNIWKWRLCTLARCLGGCG